MLVAYSGKVFFNILGTSGTGQDQRASKAAIRREGRKTENHLLILASSFLSGRVSDTVILLKKVPSNQHDV